MSETQACYDLNHPAYTITAEDRRRAIRDPGDIWTDGRREEFRAVLRQAAQETEGDHAVRRAIEDLMDAAHRLANMAHIASIYLSDELHGEFRSRRIHVDGPCDMQALPGGEPEFVPYADGPQDCLGTVYLGTARKVVDGVEFFYPVKQD